MNRSSLAGLCEGIWVVASAKELRAHTGEAPRWRVPRQGVISLAVQSGQVAALGPAGKLSFCSISDGSPLGERIVDSDFQQVIAGPGDSWVLLAGDRAAILTGTGTLDIAIPSLPPRDFETLSPSGEQRAWFDKGGLKLQKGLIDTPRTIGGWPDTDSSHAPLLVCGLAFLDETHLLMAFTNGRSHLLPIGGRPMMLDRFDGDPRISWVFVYNDEIYSGGN